MKYLSSTSIIFIFTSSWALAQNSTSVAQKKSEISVPAKVQRYNGYGLPNTKFKKIKVDLTKKKKPTDTQSSSLVTEGQLLNEKTDQELLKDIQKSTQTSTTQVKEATKSNSAFSFGFSYSPSYYIQAQNQKNNSRSEYLSHEISPSVKYGTYSLTGFFYYYDDIKNPNSNEWSDSAIILSKSGLTFGPYINFTPSLSLGLPLSKASREVTQQKYTGSIIGAISLNSKNANAGGLIASYSLNFTKMTNEFETNTKGDPVTDYRIRQRYNLGYKFTDEFILRTRFQLDTSYSTQNVARNSYYHYQMFEYNFNENFITYIGHSNGGAVYSVQESETDYTLENQIKFYGPESSEFFIGITLTI